MILITGGLGFIGSHTTKALLGKGEICIVTQHHNSVVPDFLKEYIGKQLFIEQLDITNLNGLLDLGKKYGVTRIVHLAAPKFRALDIVDDIDVNLIGFMNIIKAGRTWDVKRIAVASSIGVYGNAKNPLSENAPLSMTGANPIATSKKTFEILGDSIANTTGMDIVFFRPSAIWGPLGHQRSMFFSLPQLVHTAVSGGDTSSLGTIYADDGIDMFYVKDCGQAIALLATTPTLKHRTYNIGSGHATPNSEIVATIKTIIPGMPFELTEGRNPQSSGENIYLDVQQLRDVGFEPHYDLRQGISDYVHWLRQENVK